MPGILYHLAFAEEVYRKLDKKIELDKIKFLSGNLIPDLATDKNNSHYRKSASVDGFVVPDMALVSKDLLSTSDPVKFGMYCHLYLDYYFIEGFLIPEFIWDTKNQMVINPRNNKKWAGKTFFSHDGMYGSYTEINQLLLRDNHISLETAEKIPNILPDTGIALFDTRREKTWKDELNSYLNEKKEYTGDIFDYDRLWNSITKIANQFVEDFEISLS